MDRLAGLVERTASLADDDLTRAHAVFASDPGLDVVAVLDRHGRAVALLRRQLRTDDGTADPQVVPVSLRAVVTADVTEVAGRAMTRPPGTRFDPVVCGDTYGRYVGIVRPERLVLRLVELAASVRLHELPVTPVTSPPTS